MCVPGVQALLWWAFDPLKWCKMYLQPIFTHTQTHTVLLHSVMCIRIPHPPLRIKKKERSVCSHTWASHRCLLPTCVTLRSSCVCLRWFATLHLSDTLAAVTCVPCRYPQRGFCDGSEWSDRTCQLHCWLLIWSSYFQNTAQGKGIRVWLSSCSGGRCRANRRMGEVGSGARPHII